MIELCSESVTERAALFTSDLPCEAYVSATSRLRVTTSGVSAAAGAFQVTLLPDPLKVPSVAVHVYWRSLALDSASVTWTVTGDALRQIGEVGRLAAARALDRECADDRGRVGRCLSRPWAGREVPPLQPAARRVRPSNLNRRFILDYGTSPLIDAVAAFSVLESGSN